MLEFNIIMHLTESQTTSVVCGQVGKLSMKNQIVNILVLGATWGLF